MSLCIQVHLGHLPHGPWRFSIQVLPSQLAEEVDRGRYLRCTEYQAGSAWGSSHQKLGEDLICPAVTCLLVALTDQFFQCSLFMGERRGAGQRYDLLKATEMKLVAEPHHLTPVKRSLHDMPPSIADKESGFEKNWVHSNPDSLPLTALLSTMKWE